MNLLKSIICLTALILLFKINKAQTTTVDNALLWEVSGNGLLQPSYLFGTYHILCEKDYQIKPSVMKAFDKSSKLITEVNFMDSIQKADMLKLDSVDNNFFTQLDSVKLASFKAVLPEWGLSYDEVRNLNKVMLSSIAVIKSVPCPINNIKSFEIDFLSHAIKKNMPIIGLETVKEQFEYVESSYSAEDIIKPFFNLQASKSQFLMLVKIYKEENLYELYQIMSDSAYMSPIAKENMLDRRNVNWVKKLSSILKDGSCFVAVGAGHLPGDSGIISLLQKNGYTVRPITDK